MSKQPPHSPRSCSALLSPRAALPFARSRTAPSRFGARCRPHLRVQIVYHNEDALPEKHAAELAKVVKAAAKTGMANVGYVDCRKEEALCKVEGVVKEGASWPQYRSYEFTSPSAMVEQDGKRVARKSRFALLGTRCRPAMLPMSSL